MLSDLTREERLLLLRFVCAFAWADQEIQDEERAFITRLVKQLELDAEERAQVQDWLELGVRPEEVDPNRIPREHRQLFLEVARGLIRADGTIDADEEADYALLRRLLA